MSPAARYLLGLEVGVPWNNMQYVKEYDKCEHNRQNLLNRCNKKRGIVEHLHMVMHIP